MTDYDIIATNIPENGNINAFTEIYIIGNLEDVEIVDTSNVERVKRVGSLTYSMFTSMLNGLEEI